MIFACLRDTMSSTRTMSRSDEQADDDLRGWAAAEIRRPDTRKGSGAPTGRFSLSFTAAVGHVARPEGAQNLAILRCRAGRVNRGPRSAEYRRRPRRPSAVDEQPGMARRQRDVPDAVEHRARQRRQPVTHCADRNDLGAVRQRPLQPARAGTGCREAAAGWPARCGASHEARSADQVPWAGVPSMTRRRTRWRPAQALQVVEPDEAHPVEWATTSISRDAGLGDDRLDLARDEAGGVADVAEVERKPERVADDDQCPRWARCRSRRCREPRVAR